MRFGFSRGDDGSGKFYVGGGLGHSKYNVDCHDGNSSCSTSDLGFKVLGGYKFMRNFAVETTYMNFGQAKETFPGDGAGNVKTDAMTIAALGIVPVGSDISLFGKAGMFVSKSRANFSHVQGHSGSASSTHTDLLLGLGGQYDFTKNFIGRIEYEWLGKATSVPYGERGNTQLLSASLIYAF